MSSLRSADEPVRHGFPTVDLSRSSRRTVPARRQTMDVRFTDVSYAVNVWNPLATGTIRPGEYLHRAPTDGPFKHPLMSGFSGLCFRKKKDFEQRQRSVRQEPSGGHSGKFWVRQVDPHEHSDRLHVSDLRSPYRFEKIGRESKFKSVFVENARRFSRVIFS